MKASIFKVSSVLITALMLGPMSFAGTKGDGRDFNWNTERSRYSAELVDWSGTLRCKDHHAETSSRCDLIFTRADNGKTIDIKDSPELLAAHCKSGGDLHAKLRGEITPKFLFWGGDLKVTSFALD